MIVKVCKRCGSSEFYQNGKVCKPCTDKSNARWYEANKSKVSIRRAEYHLENQSKLNANTKKWITENKEKFRLTKAKYRATHKEKIKENKDKWNADNPGADRIYKQNRRARKLSVGGKLSNGLAEKLYMLQRGLCACGCKQPLLDNYHLDHRMPIALGGTNTDENMQLLTATCNMKKHKKHPIDFMQERGFLI